jgi:hypothetical protein
MKISNYILTGFLTFGFVIILSLFIDAKLHGKNSKNEKAFIAEEKLGYFSVLVAEEQSDFAILLGLEDKIKSFVYASETPKNQQSPRKFFRISNDTMFVQKADSVDRLIISAKSIKKIIGKKNSKISIWSLRNDTISLDLDHSKLMLSANASDINYLKIVAKNHSNISFTPTITYQKLDNGKKKRIYKEGLKSVKVSLKNHSKLNMKRPKRIDIEVDSTSTYSFYK